MLTVLALWPAIWIGSPLLFADSAGYYRGGGVAIDMLLDRLTPPMTEAPPAEPLVGAGAGRSADVAPPAADPPVIGLRSLPFSLVTNVTMRSGGVMGTVIVLSALTSWLIVLFTAVLPARARASVAVATVAATMLPFYTSQLMPDILAGTLILAAMVMAVRPDLNAWLRLAMLAIICFSITAHYAHIPLGGAICVALAIVYAARRSFGWAALSMASLIAALAVNVVVSALVPSGGGGGGLSVAPARFPIMLARSMADGPARKYLEQNCPEAGFTLCEIYETFPPNVGAALWGEDAIFARASTAQARQIIAEEPELLWEAFKAYPVEQSVALAENAWKQLFLVGFPPIASADVALDGPRELVVTRTDHLDGPTSAILTNVQLAAIAVALVGLVAGYRHMGRPTRAAFWILATGLLVNAAVCGGLSAPVNRYQGRIIWVLVLFGLTVGAMHPAWSRRDVAYSSRRASR